MKDMSLGLNAMVVWPEGGEMEGGSTAQAMSVLVDPKENPRGPENESEPARVVCRGQTARN